MYLPPHFKQEELAALHGAMRAARLATLVTLGAEGMEASHVPILLDAGEGPHGAIRGHIARANPQWRRVAVETPALAIFLGPDAYVSPCLVSDQAGDGESGADLELSRGPCLRPHRVLRGCGATARHRHGVDGARMKASATAPGP